MHEWPKRRLNLTDAQAPNYKFEDPFFNLIFSHGFFFNNSTFIHTLCKVKSYCIGLGPVRLLKRVSE